MTPDTSVYTDLQGFASLRAQAKKNPDAALEQVASQFESIFVQMMVKSMRDASEPLESDWAGSSQMKSYQQMFDQQLSLDLSGGGGLGLAQILVQQLGGAETTKSESSGSGSAELRNLETYRARDVSPVAKPILSQSLVVDRPSNTPEVEQEVVALPPEPIVEEAELTATDDQKWLPENPKEFVESLWGLAKKAGQALGLSPKVILAQAALETGWGKYMIRNQDGSNSFNLFGIKGGTQWSGEEATVPTLEYNDGIAEREIANFRSYQSLSDSFQDYVSFLANSPRYEQALNAGDDQGFLHGLQEGGYATDPNYAEKILSILKRPEFLDIGAGLKNLNRVPL